MAAHRDWNGSHGSGRLSGASGGARVTSAAILKETRGPIVDLILFGKGGRPMDTYEKPNPDLRNATIERKKVPGYRCLGKQRDGNYALMVGMATGTVDADQLSKLAGVIKEYGQAGHFTTAQSMVIVGIAEEHFERAKRAVREAGFDVRSIGRDVRQVKCCAGANLSPFGIQKTPPMAIHLENLFRGLPTPVKFKISVSGCPNCCANTMLNDFGIHGMVDGWKIFIGGKMGTVPAIAQELASNVPSDDIAKYLAAVLRVYKEMAEPDERLAKTISRLGFDAFKAEVNARLGVPFDDFIQAAKDAREKAAASDCIGLS